MPGAFSDDEREVAFARPRGISPPASDVSTVIYHQPSELSESAGIATGFNTAIQSMIGGDNEREMPNLVRGITEESFVDVPARGMGSDESFVVVEEAPTPQEVREDETMVVTVEPSGEPTESFAVIDSHGAPHSEETQPLISDAKPSLARTFTEDTEGFVTPLEEVITPFDASIEDIQAPQILDAAPLEGSLPVVDTSFTPSAQDTSRDISAEPSFEFIEPAQSTPLPGTSTEIETSSSSKSKKKKKKGKKAAAVEEPIPLGDKSMSEEIKHESSIAEVLLEDAVPKPESSTFPSGKEIEEQKEEGSKEIMIDLATPGGAGEGDGERTKANVEAPKDTQDKNLEGEIPSSAVPSLSAEVIASEITEPSSKNESSSTDKPFDEASSKSIDTTDAAPGDSDSLGTSGAGFAPLESISDTLNAEDGAEEKDEKKVKGKGKGGIDSDFAAVALAGTVAAVASIANALIPGSKDSKDNSKDDVKDEVKDVSKDKKDTKQLEKAFLEEEMPPGLNAKQRKAWKKKQDKAFLEKWTEAQESGAQTPAVEEKKEDVNEVIDTPAAVQEEINKEIDSTPLQDAVEVVEPTPEAITDRGEAAEYYNPTTSTSDAPVPATTDVVDAPKTGEVVEQPKNIVTGDIPATEILSSDPSTITADAPAPVPESGISSLDEAVKTIHENVKATETPLSLSANTTGASGTQSSGIETSTAETGKDAEIEETMPSGLNKKQKRDWLKAKKARDMERETERFMQSVEGGEAYISPDKGRPIDDEEMGGRSRPIPEAAAGKIIRKGVGAGPVTLGEASKDIVEPAEPVSAPTIVEEVPKEATEVISDEPTTIVVEAPRLEPEAEIATLDDAVKAIHDNVEATKTPLPVSTTESNAEGTDTPLPSGSEVIEEEMPKGLNKKQKKAWEKKQKELKIQRELDAAATSEPVVEEQPKEVIEPLPEVVLEEQSKEIVEPVSEAVNVEETSKEITHPIAEVISEQPTTEQPATVIVEGSEPAPEAGVENLEDAVKTIHDNVEATATPSVEVAETITEAGIKEADTAGQSSSNIPIEEEMPKGLNKTQKKAWQKKQNEARIQRELDAAAAEAAKVEVVPMIIPAVSERAVGEQSTEVVESVSAPDIIKETKELIELTPEVISEEPATIVVDVPSPVPEGGIESFEDAVQTIHDATSTPPEISYTPVDDPVVQVQSSSDISTEEEMPKGLNKKQKKAWQKKQEEARIQRELDAAAAQAAHVESEVTIVPAEVSEPMDEEQSKDIMEATPEAVSEPIVVEDVSKETAEPTSEVVSEPVVVEEQSKDIYEPISDPVIIERPASETAETPIETPVEVIETPAIISDEPPKKMNKREKKAWDKAQREAEAAALAAASEPAPVVSEEFVIPEVLPTPVFEDESGAFATAPMATPIPTPLEKPTAADISPNEADTVSLSIENAAALAVFDPEAAPGDVSLSIEDAASLAGDLPQRKLSKKDKKALEKAQKAKELEMESTTATEGEGKVAVPVDASRDIQEIEQNPDAGDVVEDEWGTSALATPMEVPSMISPEVATPLETPAEAIEVSLGGKKKKKKKGKGKTAEVVEPESLPESPSAEPSTETIHESVSKEMDAVPETVIDPVAETLALLGGISRSRAISAADVQPSIESTEQQIESPTDDDDAFHSAAEDRGRSETPTGTIGTIDDDEFKDFHSTNGDDFQSPANGHNAEPEVVLETPPPLMEDTKEPEVASEEDFAPISGKKKKKKKKGKGVTDSGEESGSATPGETEKDSFLANAGTLGAGVGSATVLEESQRDINSGIGANAMAGWGDRPSEVMRMVMGDREEETEEGTVVGVVEQGDVYAGQTFVKKKDEKKEDPVQQTMKLEGIDRQPKLTDILNDPEIKEREVLPSVDPQFGDLLPLPPRDSPPNEELDGGALQLSLPLTPVIEQQQQPQFQSMTLGGIQEQNEPSENKEELFEIDPEIQERKIHPSVDPQYGDLLPLPPSQPGSPARSLEEEILTTQLPDSPPESPALARLSLDSSSPQTPKKKDTTHLMRSPSISAVPLKFLLGNRSTPSSPVVGKGSPVLTSPTRSEFTERPKSRHSWDSSKGLQPLQLLERRHSRGSSLANFDSRALVPLLETGQGQHDSSPERAIIGDDNAVLTDDGNTSTPAEAFATALSEKAGEAYFGAPADVAVEIAPTPIEAPSEDIGGTTIPAPIEAILQPLPETPLVSSTDSATKSATFTEEEMPKGLNAKARKAWKAKQRKAKEMFEAEQLSMKSAIVERETEAEVVAPMNVVEAPSDVQIQEVAVEKSGDVVDAPIETVGVRVVDASIETPLDMPADTAIQGPDTAVVEDITRDIPETPVTVVPEPIFETSAVDESQPAKKLNKKQRQALAKKLREEAESGSASTSGGWMDSGAQTPVEDISAQEVIPETVDAPVVETMEPVQEIVPAADTPSSGTISDFDAAVRALHDKFGEPIESIKEAPVIEAPIEMTAAPEAPVILEGVQSDTPIIEAPQEIPTSVTEPAPFVEEEMPSGLNAKQRKAWKKKQQKAREDYEFALTSTSAVGSGVQNPGVAHAPIEVVEETVKADEESESAPSATGLSTGVPVEEVTVPVIEPVGSAIDPTIYDVSDPAEVPSMPASETVPGEAPVAHTLDAEGIQPAVIMPPYEGGGLAAEYFEGMGTPPQLLSPTTRANLLSGEVPTEQLEQVTLNEDVSFAAGSKKSKKDKKKSMIVDDEQVSESQGEKGDADSSAFETTSSRKAKKKKGRGKDVEVEPAVREVLSPVETKEEKEDMGYDVVRNEIAAPTMLPSEVKNAFSRPPSPGATTDGAVESAKDKKKKKKKGKKGAVEEPETLVIAEPSLESVAIPIESAPDAPFQSQEDKPLPDVSAELEAAKEVDAPASVIQIESEANDSPPTPDAVRETLALLGGISHSREPVVKIAAQPDPPHETAEESVSIEQPAPVIEETPILEVPEALREFIAEPSPVQETPPILDATLAQDTPAEVAEAPIELAIAQENPLSETPLESSSGSPIEFVEEPMPSGLNAKARKAWKAKQKKAKEVFEVEQLAKSATVETEAEPEVIEEVVKIESVLETPSEEVETPVEVVEEIESVEEPQPATEDVVGELIAPEPLAGIPAESDAIVDTLKPSIARNIPLPESSGSATPVESTEAETDAGGKKKKKKKGKKGAVVEEAEAQPEIIAGSASIQDPGDVIEKEIANAPVQQSIEAPVELSQESETIIEPPTIIDDTPALAPLADTPVEADVPIDNFEPSIARNIILPESGPSTPLESSAESPFVEEEMPSGLNAKQRKAWKKKQDKAKADWKAGLTSGLAAESGMQSPVFEAAEQVVLEPVDERTVVEEAPAPIENIVEAVGVSEPVEANKEIMSETAAEDVPIIEPQPAPEDIAKELPIPETPLEAHTTISKPAIFVEEEMPPGLNAEARKAWKKKQDKARADFDTASKSVSTGDSGFQTPAVKDINASVAEPITETPLVEETPASEPASEPMIVSELVEASQSVPVDITKELATISEPEAVLDIAKETPIPETPMETPTATNEVSVFVEEEMPAGLNAKARKAWKKKQDKAREEFEAGLASTSAGGSGMQTPAVVKAMPEPEPIVFALEEVQEMSREVELSEPVANSQLLAIDLEQLPIVSEQPAPAKTDLESVLQQIPAVEAISEPPALHTAPLEEVINSSVVEDVAPTSFLPADAPLHLSPTVDEPTTIDQDSQIPASVDTIGEEMPKGLNKKQQKAWKKKQAGKPASASTSAPGSGPQTPAVIEPGVIVPVPEESQEVSKEITEELTADTSLSPPHEDIEVRATPQLEIGGFIETPVAEISEPTLPEPPIEEPKEVVQDTGTSSEDVEEEMPKGLNKKQKKAWEKAKKERDEQRAADEAALAAVTVAEVEQPVQGPIIESTEQPIEPEIVTGKTIEDVAIETPLPAPTKDTPLATPLESESIDEWAPIKKLTKKQQKAKAQREAELAAEADTSAGSAPIVEPVLSGEEPIVERAIEDVADVASLETLSDSPGHAPIMEGAVEEVGKEVPVPETPLEGENQLETPLESQAEEQEDVMPKGLNKKQKKAWEKAKKERDEQRAAELATAAAIAAAGTAVVLEQPMEDLPQVSTEAEVVAAMIPVPETPLELEKQLATPIESQFEDEEMPKGLNKKQKKAWEKKQEKLREERASSAASAQQSGFQTPAMIEEAAEPEIIIEPELDINVIPEPVAESPVVENTAADAPSKAIMETTFDSPTPMEPTIVEPVAAEIPLPAPTLETPLETPAETESSVFKSTSSKKLKKKKGNKALLPWEDEPVAAPSSEMTADEMQARMDAEKATQIQNVAEEAPGQSTATIVEPVLQPVEIEEPIIETDVSRDLPDDTVIEEVKPSIADAAIEIPLPESTPATPMETTEAESLSAFESASSKKTKKKKKGKKGAILEQEEPVSPAPEIILETPVEIEEVIEPTAKEGSEPKTKAEVVVEQPVYPSNPDDLVNRPSTDTVWIEDAEVIDKPPVDTARDVVMEDVSSTPLPTEEVAKDVPLPETPMETPTESSGFESGLSKKASKKKKKGKKNAVLWEEESPSPTPESSALEIVEEGTKDIKIAVAPTEQHIEVPTAEHVTISEPVLHDTIIEVEHPSTPENAEHVDVAVDIQEQGSIDEPSHETSQSPTPPQVSISIDEPSSSSDQTLSDKAPDPEAVEDIPENTEPPKTAFLEHSASGKGLISQQLEREGLVSETGAGEVGNFGDEAERSEAVIEQPQKVVEVLEQEEEVMPKGLNKKQKKAWEKEKEKRRVDRELAAADAEALAQAAKKEVQEIVEKPVVESVEIERDVDVVEKPKLERKLSKKEQKAVDKKRREEEEHAEYKAKQREEEIAEEEIKIDALVTPVEQTSRDIVEEPAIDMKTAEEIAIEEEWAPTRKLSKKEKKALDKKRKDADEQALLRAATAAVTVGAASAAAVTVGAASAAAELLTKDDPAVSEPKAIEEPSPSSLIEEKETIKDTPLQVTLRDTMDEPSTESRTDSDSPPANTKAKRRDRGKGKANEIVDEPSDRSSRADNDTPVTAIFHARSSSPASGIFQQALEKVVEKQVQQRDLQENITKEAVKGSWAFSSLADEDKSDTPWSASRLPPVLEEDALPEQPRTPTSPTRARSPVQRSYKQEDSGYVPAAGESPKSRQRSWFDPEYVRDSGVQLREKRSSDSQRSLKEQANTDDVLVRRSWPPVDEERETVDLRRKKRPSLKDSQSSPYEKITPGDIAKAATGLGIASGSKRSLSKSPALSESPSREFLLRNANRSQTPSSDEKGNSSSTSSRVPSALRGVDRSETPRSASDRQHQRQSSLLESLHHDRTDSPRSFSDQIQNPRTRTPRTPQEREEYYNRGATPTLSERGLGWSLSRPTSVISNRSVTPSLRRVSGRASSDLRALSQSDLQAQQNQESREAGAKDKSDSGSASDAADKKPSPTISDVNNKSDSNISASGPPNANEGRQRVKGMAEVYNGFGEGRMGSPRSPTRPHSMRRKQSMQLLDMQAQMAAMAEELAAARQEKAVILQAKEAAERNLDEARREASRAGQYKAQAEEVRGLLESMTLKNTDLTRQTLDLQAQLELRDNGAEAAIAAAVAAAIASKEEEVQQLRARVERLSHDWSGDEREIEELETIIAGQKQEIATLRASQATTAHSTTGGPDYLADFHRDDTYFEQSCQKLFRGVWRWIHAFSDRRKHSSISLEDIKSLPDQRMYSWLRDAFAGNPSAYLADLDKRRLILMSLTMSLFHHYIFSKHFFGLSSEQEEASKVLEMIVDESDISDAEFRTWRATQFCLFSKSHSYTGQRNAEVLAVTQSVLSKLSSVLPQPSSSASDEQRTRILVEELRIIVKKAAELSNDMRRQRSKYVWQQSPKALWGEKRSKAPERFMAGSMTHAEICVQFMELHRVDEKLSDASVSEDARAGLNRERAQHLGTLVRDFHVISEDEAMVPGFRLAWEEMLRRMEEKNRRIEEKGMGVRLTLFPMVIREGDDRGTGATKQIIWKAVVKPVDLKIPTPGGKRRTSDMGSVAGGSEHGSKHPRTR